MIIGFAYKANTTDFRNTKVIDVYTELKSFGIEVDIYDPLVDKDEVLRIYGVKLVTDIDYSNYSLITDLSTF